ncbi:hypothetical protein [uncultured Adlercreutzia sp.]|uniref:hypothetical protein n=1 Tax=uncultured Adlercreutzia sp. TaxID=875803 RepID=UPI0026F3B12B|nr:hypothetical protein [uncultured Adlercreutzia sp.]
MAEHLAAFTLVAALSGGSPRATETKYDVTVSGGTPGIDYEFVEETYVRHARTGNVTATNDLKKLVVKTSTPLTISTRDPETVTTNITLWIDPGVQANVTLNGVNIDSPIPCHIERNCNAAGDTIEPKTSLRLTVAKGSKNKITATDGQGAPGIHCGEGTELIIDDDVPNVDTSGTPIAMDPSKYPGKIPAGITFKGNDGKTYTAGTTPGADRLSLLESSNPGSLEVTGDYNQAGIGSVNFENSGTMTFNGGRLTVTTRGSGNGSMFGAAIGGGAAGSGGTMTFNGGEVETWTSYHGASIGGGAWAASYHLSPSYLYLFKDSIDNGIVLTAEGGPHTVAPESKTCAGDIFINGGVIVPHGDAHGNAIGQGCCSWNKDHIIVIAGGTVLPDSSRATDKGGDPRTTCVSMGIGAQDGAVCVIGGSVRIGKVPGRSDELFQAFINGADSYDSAFGIYPVDTSRNDNPAVSMVTIDLSAEVIKKDDAGNPITAGDNLIIDWDLKIGGVEHDYGSPTRFTDGKLYLWLPPEAKKEQVQVTLSYLDENGQVKKVDPLFRNPGQDDILKRYIDFELPQRYTDSLTKYYDGTPLAAYDLHDKNNWITTEEEIPKVISDPDALAFRYQRYTAKDGAPIGPEVAADPDGKPLKSMPSDVGIMKFTMTSTQYSNSTDPDLAGFKQNYWGHRATGWCEIMPIGSKVGGIKATWEDGKDGSEQEKAERRLTVEADITRADRDPGGAPTADTCQAPRGRVQLYVDGKPVGDPVTLVFPGDTGPDGKPLPEDSPLVNARAVDNGRGGSHTHFSFSFVPADEDFLVPDATTDKKHEVAVRYLPPAEDAADAPGNYLASADPQEDPDVPRAEVAIEPIDPKVEISLKDPKPGESLTSQPPTADGDGWRHVTGSITGTYAKHEPDEPNPNRLTLKLKTPSSGPITVETGDGRIIEAEVLVGDDGQPVRDENGDITIYVDPEAVGKTTLTVTQKPNGAYVGTIFEYDVTVKADPSIAPEPALSKKAENLTHPDGPTQPGDRIRYTITAANTAAGSAWTSVVVTDAVPAALEVDEATVRLHNPADAFSGALAKRSAAATRGEFSLSAAGADGKRTLTAPVGTVYGGAEAVLTFECTVKEGIVGRDEPGADLGNRAEAEGSRENPDDPDAPELPVPPADTPTVYPPGTHEVAPSDPDGDKLTLAKSVENVTAPDAKVTRVGDVLRYRIAVANEGPADSCLTAASICDPLPAGIEPVPGTFRLAVGDGEAKPIEDAVYDAESRTVSVSVGNLWGGERAELVFECTVTVDALGTEAANVARLHGTVPSDEPELTVTPEPEPGTPAPVPDPDDPDRGPVAENEPVAPPRVIGEDPDEGDVTVTKSSENTSRTDGSTRVGDVIRYTVVLENTHVGTAWMDAVLRDEVPEGLEPIAGSIKLTLPGGATADVDDAAYDDRIRVLSVAVGELLGGTRAVLVFDALVTEKALDADIGNIAVASGTLPSQWNPDGNHPEPGAPFVPDEGWDAYDRGHETARSNASYAPGTDADTPPLPAEGPVDDSGTIAKTRLAQTGDALGRLAGTLAGAAAGSLLVAGALALATRRRARSAR